MVFGDAINSLWLLVWRSPSSVSPRLIEKHSLRDLLFAIPAFVISEGIKRVPGRLLAGQQAIWRSFFEDAGAALVSIIIGFFVLTYLYYLAGRMLGGRGSLSRIRIAYLVSAVLSLFLLPLEMVLWSVTGWLGSAYSVFYFVLVVWYVIVLLHMQGAAHFFSPWRALMSSLIALIMLAVPLGLIAGAAIWILN